MPTRKFTAEILLAAIEGFEARKRRIPTLGSPISDRCWTEVTQKQPLRRKLRKADGES